MGGEGLDVEWGMSCERNGRKNAERSEWRSGGKCGGMLAEKGVMGAQVGVRCTEEGGIGVEEGGMGVEEGVMGVEDGVMGVEDGARGAVGDVRGAVGDVRGAVGDVKGADGDVKGAVGDVRGAVEGVRGAVEGVTGAEKGGEKGPEMVVDIVVVGMDYCCWNSHWLTSAPFLLHTNIQMGCTENPNWMETIQLTAVPHQRKNCCWNLRKESRRVPVGCCCIRCRRLSFATRHS